MAKKKRASDGNRRARVHLPSQKMPKLPTIPRAARGYGLHDVTVKARGLKGASTFPKQEPAGDPPNWWKQQYPSGTRPEWAVYWAFLTLKMVPGIDFIYQAKMPGIGSSYFSTLDFLVRDIRIGIEVQGTFWHLKQGTKKIETDRMRRVLYAGLGVKIIFIDEPDCLANPRYFVQEALRGVDHSKLKV